MTLTIPTHLKQFYTNLPPTARIDFEDRVGRMMKDKIQASIFETYWDRPIEYIDRFLHWSPWSGAKYNTTGQLEILEFYQLILRQQRERQNYENGLIKREDLLYWSPGTTIQNWISIDAGHNVGKTALSAAIVCHFFDCFRPSITYCFAPQYSQVDDLLFREIRTHRFGTDLPGRTLERRPRIVYKHDHFVSGRATASNTKAKTERIQGQHSVHLMFAVDEAEGIEDYVFEAIQSMISGGFGLVLFTRNPRTTFCRAHQLRSLPHVKPFTISCLDTPNVVEDRDVIPSMVRRDYIENMLEYTETVASHNPEDYTFTLPWRPGVIYKPLPEFMWRVMGIASSHIITNSFCSYGRYDAAVARGRDTEFKPDATWAYFGIDAARFGGDFGTIYIRRGDWLWRCGNFQSSDSFTFYGRVIEEMKKLVADGVTHIEVRIDAGGGWGAGVYDLLVNDIELKHRHIHRSDLYPETPEFNLIRQKIEKENEWSPLEEFQVIEVNSNGKSSKPRDYANMITELYDLLGKAMEILHLYHPPTNLKIDLCERTFGYGMKSGYSVKAIAGRDYLRREYNRSPDDGDGAALANAPSNIFKKSPLLLWAG